MAIYVDPLAPCKTKSFNWRHIRACHLYADSLEELHQFAADHLQLKPDWFKNRSDLPHYQLMGGKRRAAIEAGAIETTPEHLQEYIERKQKENKKRKPK